MILALASALALASPSSGLPALDEAVEHGVATAALTSDTFLGAALRSTHAVGPVSVGGGADLPLMLWAQGGGLDTFRLVGQATAEPLRGGALGLVVHGQTRLGLQVDALGTRLPWDLDIEVAPVVHLRRSVLGLSAGWHQGLATFVHHGPLARAAWEDRYAEGQASDGPRDGWLAAPSSRWSLGPLASVHLGERVVLLAELDGVGTVDRVDVGPADLMMLGRWPFHAALGVGWRW